MNAPPLPYDYHQAAHSPSAATTHASSSNNSSTADKTSHSKPIADSQEVMNNQTNIITNRNNTPAKPTQTTHHQSEAKWTNQLSNLQRITGLQPARKPKQR